MSAEKIEDMLIDQFCDDDSALGQNVRSADSFREAGVLTTNLGVVLTMTNGSEFQITIVQSRRPR
jgi:hypothetical protein